MNDAFKDACLEASTKMVSYPDRRALEQLAELPESAREGALAKLAESPRRTLEQCLKSKDGRPERPSRSGSSQPSQRGASSE